MSAREWGDLWVAINREGWSTFQFVRGQVVSVAPHLPNATFCIIRPCDYPDGGPQCWRIINIETGSCIRQADAATADEAVKTARRLLRRKTPAHLAAAYQKQIKRSAALRGEAS